MDDNQNQFKETIAEYMRYMLNKLELRLEWLCW